MNKYDDDQTLGAQRDCNAAACLYYFRDVGNARPTRSLYIMSPNIPSSREESSRDALSFGTSLVEPMTVMITVATAANAVSTAKQ